MITATAPAPRHAKRSTAGIPVTAPVSVAAEGRAVPVPDRRALSAWAARIDADGISTHEDLARDLVAAASRRGLCPVLVDVLADPREPAGARERAVGRLALALTLAA